MIVALRALLHEQQNEDPEGQPVWMLARHLREHQLVVSCSETSCLVQAEYSN